MQRYSCDKGRVNKYGNLLLECCKRCGLFICNGKIFKDRTIGRNTCKDSSLVYYLIVHPSMFDFISYFKVEDFNPMFSDVHCRLSLTLLFNTPNKCNSILVLPVLDSVRNISPVCPLETIIFYKIVFVCLSKLVLYFY